MSSSLTRRMYTRSRFSGCPKSFLGTVLGNGRLSTFTLHVKWFWKCLGNLLMHVIWSYGFGLVVSCDMWHSPSITPSESTKTRVQGKKGSLIPWFTIIGCTGMQLRKSWYDHIYWWGKILLPIRSKLLWQLLIQQLLEVIFNAQESSHVLQDCSLRIQHQLPISLERFTGKTEFVCDMSLLSIFLLSSCRLTSLDVIHNTVHWSCCCFL